MAIKIKFYANDIKEVKTKFTKKQLVDLDETAKRFAEDMLAKHDLLFTKTPHVIGIDYGDMETI